MSVTSNENNTAFGAQYSMLLARAMRNPSKYEYTKIMFLDMNHSYIKAKRVQHKSYTKIPQIPFEQKYPHAT